MQDKTTTRVDRVLAALLELCELAKPMESVFVLEGDQPLDQVDDALLIGPSDPDSPGFVVTYGPTPNRQPAEQIEVALVARSFAGDSDMAPRRHTCAAIVGSVQRVVWENPVREQTWDRIEMGPTALWHPVWTERGCNCFVGFSVIATSLL